MELDEIRERIAMRGLMEERNRQSHAPSRHPCEGMSLQEVLDFVNFLMDSLQKKDAELKSITQKLDAIMNQLEDTRSENRKYADSVSALTVMLNSMKQERDEAVKALEKKKGENAVNRKFRFAGHSQKGTAAKQQTQGRDDDKDDFDGTQPPGTGTQQPDTAGNTADQPAAKKERPERKGMKYNTMDAQCKKFHPCDRTRLPEGSVVISTEIRKAFDRVCYIVEHDFEYVTYRTQDGSMHTGYFPMAAEQLQKLLPALKAKALAPDSVINVDETWGRLHLVKTSRKVYIWCLVNRLAKTAIFFYDNGSRGRAVLKDFIGDAELAALQSDGYNAYNYIDGQLVKIEHICCLAHARAKFKYAQEQGQDDRATYFLERIAKLYRLESEYKTQGLNFDEIKARRNSAETADILTELSCRLHELRNDGLPKSDLMEKALNYLAHFWKQIFNYRNDGRYSIDNSIAEQFIRPLTRERSNSIHFASHRGAEVSAIFHTVFSTCRMVGVSALDYLKKYFEAILDGRTDYDNLLPSTIGLKVQ